MTHTKQIKIFNEWIASDKGDHILYVIYDRYANLNNPPVREKFTVSAVAVQFTNKSGTVYDAFSQGKFSFKDIRKAVEKNQYLHTMGIFEDSKRKFDEKHPDYEEKLQNKYMSAVNTIIGANVGEIVHNPRIVPIKK